MSNQLGEKYLWLHMGFEVRRITMAEVRETQERVLVFRMTESDRALVDAVLSLLCKSKVWHTVTEPTL